GGGVASGAQADEGSVGGARRGGSRLATPKLVKGTRQPKPGARGLEGGATLLVEVSAFLQPGCRGLMVATSCEHRTLGDGTHGAERIRPNDVRDLPELGERG